MTFVRVDRGRAKDWSIFQAVDRRLFGSGHRLREETKLRSELDDRPLEIRNLVRRLVERDLALGIDQNAKRNRISFERLAQPAIRIVIIRPSNGFLQNKC